jgi:hypothetical protein
VSLQHLAGRWQHSTTEHNHQEDMEMDDNKWIYPNDRRPCSGKWGYSDDRLVHNGKWG